MGHVVGPCRRVHITYFDGTFTIGTIIARDEAHDLVRILPDAVPTDLSVATLAYRTPQLGETLHCIGHPSGLGWTYSRGYVSFNKKRKVTFDNGTYSLIPVNIDVYGGSSGGGLFNERGRLVGFGEGYVDGTAFAFFTPASAVCQKLFQCSSF